MYGINHPRGGKKNTFEHNNKVSIAKKQLYQNPEKNPMFGRTKEINVFDIETHLSVRISTKLFYSDKERYLAFTSKKYKDFKNDLTT